MEPGWGWRSISPSWRLRRIRDQRSQRHCTVISPLYKTVFQAEAAAVTQYSGRQSSADCDSWSVDHFKVETRWVVFHICVKWTLLLRCRNLNATSFHASLLRPRPESRHGIQSQRALTPDNCTNSAQTAFIAQLYNCKKRHPVVEHFYKSVAQQSTAT